MAKVGGLPKRCVCSCVWQLRKKESAGKCHKDIAALLGKKGADARTGGGNGLTPLRAAVLNGQKDMAALLEKNGAAE